MTPQAPCFLYFLHSTMLFPLMRTLLMASSRFQESMKGNTMHVLIRLLPEALSYQTKPWYQDWDTSLGIGEGGS